MTDEKQTIHVDADTVKKFWPLYEEWSQNREAMLSEAIDQIDRLIKLAELRTSFFEKLILLATGSFALSLTFLASLHRHESLGIAFSASWCLKLSWVLLLNCIVFGWLHNLFRCASMERLSTTASKSLKTARLAITKTFMNRAGELFKNTKIEEINLGEFFSLAADSTEKLMKEAQSEMEKFGKETVTVARQAGWLGSISFFSIFFAFLLLLIFAIDNISLL